MRFLADENFPGDAVAALRSTGHDVTWVRTAMPGSADADILETAQRERRVLLTFDRDFGGHLKSQFVTSSWTGDR